MYRICIARSGYYYVQQRGWDWKMVGPFFRTRRGAENFISGIRVGRGCCCTPRVVGYY